MMNFIVFVVFFVGVLFNNFLYVKVVVDGEDMFVFVGDGFVVMFLGVDYFRVSARMDVFNYELIIDIKCVGMGEWFILMKESGCFMFKLYVSGR